MAEPARGSLPREPRTGMVSGALEAAANVLKWLLLSLLFSILTEWVGMVWWWPEAGSAHSRAMLAAELRWLQRDYQRSLLVADPPAFGQRVADQTDDRLFVRTRIRDALHWARSPAAVDAARLERRLHAAMRPLAEYLQAAMQVTQVFAVRLAILWLASPVFVLFSLVAVVDGLVQRDLRRWGGGRESSFVYHWAKRSALPLLILCGVSYLALPFSVHPSLVVLPFASLFALSLAITASTFKKYL